MIRQIGHAGQRNFPTTLVGKKSSLLTVLLTNVGNDDLNVSNQILEGNNPGDFTPDPDTTSCTWKASLPPGQSCQLGFSFSPKAAGLRTAYVTFVDNTATFQNTLYLNGVGLAAPVTPTIAIVSPMSGAQYYNGVNTPVTVTVGNNIGPIYTPPTGTVTLTVTNIATSVVAGTYGPFNLAPIAGASKSSINTPLTGLAVGKYSIAAAYSGDTIDTSATSSVASFKVVPVIPTITWPTPSFVYVGTKLSSTQLDATAAAFGASLPGTFVYTPRPEQSRVRRGHSRSRWSLPPTTTSISLLTPKQSSSWFCNRLASSPGPPPR